MRPCRSVQVGSTVSETLHCLAEELAKSGSDAPQLEARLLLEAALDRSRVWLYQNPHVQIDDVRMTHLRSMVDRRTSGAPLPYVVGWREFYGRLFKVDSRVLVPRPETEILLESAIAFVRRAPSPRILDVGTGSGVLAISLALEVADARVVAVDLSEDAIAVAEYNCRRHGVESRVRLIQADVLAGLDETFDLVVANLPYVPTGEIPRLQAEIQHEPRLALDGGRDGLEVYRRFFAEVVNVLAPGGAIFVEIGHGQGEAGSALARRYFGAHDVQVELDLAGRERVIAITPSLE